MSIEADINDAENKRAVNRNKIKSRRKQISPMLEGLDWKSLAGIHQSLLFIQKDPERRQEFNYFTGSIPIEISRNFPDEKARNDINRFINKLTASTSFTDKMGHVIKSTGSLSSRVKAMMENNNKDVIPMSTKALGEVIKVVSQAFNNEFRASGAPKIPRVDTQDVFRKYLHAIGVEEEAESLATKENKAKGEVLKRDKYSSIDTSGIKEPGDIGTHM